jgi:vanillate O-demethylase ferredoxin subunit
MLIRQIRLESSDTVSLELVAKDRQPLPQFAAGAHVNVHVPDGPSRSYSLVNSPSQTDHYVIAVKREPQSRGGSAWFHEKARVGMTLHVSPPANEFALEEAAAMSVFIAGGIGITPMLSMIGRLKQLGRPWQLHYSARGKEQMAFADLVQEMPCSGQGEVHLYFTAGGTGRMKLEVIEAATQNDAHFYCCGPTNLIDAFVAAMRDRQAHTVHYERFTSSQEAASDGGFALNLLRDGRTLPVPKGKSILDVLLEAGLNVEYACTQGVCGTCKVFVSGGVPDHRDDCLTEVERASNATIITCCSGSRSPVLMLDL